MRNLFRSRVQQDLETCRRDALLCLRETRVGFEAMMVRANSADEVPNPAIVSHFTSATNDCERLIKQSSDSRELERLAREVRKHGRLRAYICPQSEVAMEANLILELMQDWGVPPASLEYLRTLLKGAVQVQAQNPSTARAVLYTILRQEADWNKYTDDYEKHLLLATWGLVGAIGVFVLAAFWTLRLNAWYPFLPILLAGAAGSCASVIFRLPVLHVTSSQDAVSLVRRIVGRVATGTVGSVAGCAFLAWGLIPLTVNKESYTDLLSTCSTSPCCSGRQELIQLAVPIVFGFTERVLSDLGVKLFEKRGRTKIST
jgi:hypothetical protein